MTTGDKSIVPRPIEPREDNKAASRLRARRVMVAVLYLLIAAALVVCAFAMYLVPANCPACRRKALLHAARQMPGNRTYHDYYWCLRCSDRFKRLENGPWEKAWSPHDDGFYWLWRSGKCLDI